MQNKKRIEKISAYAKHLPGERCLPDPQIGTLDINRDTAKQLIDSLIAWDAEQVRWERRSNLQEPIHKLSRKLQQKLLDMLEAEQRALEQSLQRGER